MSDALRPAIDMNLIRMTIPDNPNSRNRQAPSIIIEDLEFKSLPPLQLPYPYCRKLRILHKIPPESCVSHIRNALIPA